MQRRSTAVTFTSSETDVIVADRAGDVYRYSVEDSGKEGELLQGHLSMLLDVVSFVIIKSLEIRTSIVQ